MLDADQPLFVKKSNRSPGFVKHCLQVCIEDLFKSLTKIETLGSAKFIEFLNDKQRDSRLNQILYPEYNKKRVMEIITMFEPDPENVKLERISKEGFIRYLMSDDNAPVLLDRLC